MLTGAILAGGRSRRYGRDKTLERFEGERLIDRGVSALHRHCDPVFVIANDLSLYTDVQATLIQDMTPHQGPLGGIYTALLFSPNPWVFVKAADMPFWVPELLALLLSFTEGCDAVVPLSGDRFEPLFALYHQRCLTAIADVMERSERQIIAFYGKVQVRTVSEAQWRTVDPEGLGIRNVNTPEDWTRWT